MLAATALNANNPFKIALPKTDWGIHDPIETGKFSMYRLVKGSDTLLGKVLANPNRYCTCIVNAQNCTSLFRLLCPNVLPSIVMHFSLPICCSHCPCMIVLSYCHMQLSSIHADLTCHIPNSVMKESSMLLWIVLSQTL